MGELYDRKLDIGQKPDDKPVVLLAMVRNVDFILKQLL